MSGRAKTVAATISAHYDAILRMWRAAARKVVSEKGRVVARGSNLIPAYLRSLADPTLGPLGEESRARADIVESHLGARLQDGFDLGEVVEEFALLGRCVSHTWASLPPEERPDPSDVESFHAELHLAAAHAARVFEEHMRDEDESARRFARRLEAAATRPSATAEGPSADVAGDVTLDLGALLAVIAEALGAHAATITIEDFDRGGIVAERAVGEPRAAAAMRAFASCLSMPKTTWTGTTDFVGARQLSADDRLRRTGIRRVLVAQLPAGGTRRRATLALGIADERPFHARQVRRAEALAERLAVHIESCLLQAELRCTVVELRAEKAWREAFVAALAHDLRGPLSTAQCQAQLLAGSEMPPHDVREAAARIDRVLGRADRMVRDLLDANRIRAGEKLPLLVTRFDIVGLVRETIDELSMTYPGRFDFEGPDPIEGYWSADQLRRAIWNLGVNAIKYGCADRPVRVRVAQHDDSVAIAVHNEGAPIPQEQRAHLFDAFRRATSAQRHGKPGWGLGLTLVRGTAEAHGGKVTCESVPGRGTTFTIDIPIDARPFQTSSAPAFESRADATTVHHTKDEDFAH